MSYISNILMKLTKGLYPSGRAFRMPDKGVFKYFTIGYLLQVEEAYNNILAVEDGYIPDNDNFTETDATFQERRFGLIVNTAVSLADRKLALIRKMNHPGTIKARQNWRYVQAQLRASGFDVYIFENRFLADPINILTDWDKGTFENLPVDLTSVNPDSISNPSSVGRDSDNPRTGVYSLSFFAPVAGIVFLGGGFTTTTAISLTSGETYILEGYALFEQIGAFAYINDPLNESFVRMGFFTTGGALITADVTFDTIEGNATTYTKITATIIPSSDIDVVIGSYKGGTVASVGAQKIYLDDVSVFIPPTNFVTKTPQEIAISPNTNVVQHGQFQHGATQHGQGYTYQIVNSIDNANDALFNVGDNFKSTFFISSSVLGINAVIPEARETEFRQLVLKLKPVQTVAFPFISFTPPVESNQILEDDVELLELEDGTLLQLENSFE